MENKGEHPVLLSYNMSERQKFTYLFLPVAGLLVEMVLLLFWTRAGGRGLPLYIAPCVLIAISYFLLFTPFWRAAAKVECTAVGIYIASVPFPESWTFMPWGRLRAIRHGMWGFAVLEFAGAPAAFVWLPAEQEARLVALIREASDARTAGW